MYNKNIKLQISLFCIFSITCCNSFGASSIFNVSVSGKAGLQPIWPLYRSQDGCPPAFPKTRTAILRGHAGVQPPLAYFGRVTVQNCSSCHLDSHIYWRFVFFCVFLLEGKFCDYPTIVSYNGRHVWFLYVLCVLYISIGRRIYCVYIWLVLSAPSLHFQCFYIVLWCFYAMQVFSSFFFFSITGRLCLSAD